MSLESFQRLHQGDRPLLLAHAWEAGGARLFAQLVAGQPMPLAVRACPGLPDLETLSRLFVRRTSLAQACLGLRQARATAHPGDGPADALPRQAADDGAVNRRFAT